MRTWGNANGLLIEPISPAFLLNKHHFKVKDKLKLKILGLIRE